MPPPAAVLDLLMQRIPRLMAVYAFGSRVQGTATLSSDWDLAVLVEGHADPVLLWDTQAAIYEAAVLSEMTALNTARAPLLADIAASGRVYGR